MTYNRSLITQISNRQLQINSLLRSRHRGNRQRLSIANEQHAAQANGYELHQAQNGVPDVGVIRRRTLEGMDGRPLRYQEREIR